MSELFTLIVELEDKPGQLLRVLEPIARNGGNIVGIFHQRGKKTPLNRIPVEISFRVDSKKAEKIIEELQREFLVRSFGKLRTAVVSLLLIGHVIHTDLSDTIKRVDNSDAECVELNVTMPELNEPSTAMITISAKSEEALEKALERVREICKEKKIMVIEPINDEI
ncbi:MAG: ACT domain-containing protein [Archaeoglobaceae archaeon]|nr:ACT domain-containing protein [Archaeoglobaceae archaeon]MDW8128501.1 ACT domain-containing protein [Archaeoglobaceae archaeon]